MHAWCRQELEALEGALEEALSHAHTAEQRATVASKELKVRHTDNDTSDAIPFYCQWGAADTLLATRTRPEGTKPQLKQRTPLHGWSTHDYTPSVLAITRAGAKPMHWVPRIGAL